MFVISTTIIIKILILIFKNQDLIIQNYFYSERLNSFISLEC